MAQNKKKIQSKQGANHDDKLLKKLPGLLAFCEFVLIPTLIISSPPLTSSSENVISPQKDTSPTASVGYVPSPVKQVIQVTVTAYSSTEDQTDSTPFHTANGRAVQEGIVAANFLPLGTRLRIPEVSGDRVFTVEDRMHERFDRHLDIWMPSRKAAQEFGIRYLTVEIL